jgi:hypothetical protein
MSGINPKCLLPLPRVQAEVSEATPAGERKRKRKGSSKGETSQPEPCVTPEVLRTEAPQIGVDDLPPTDQTDTELDLGVLNKGPGPSMELAPVWVPSFEVYGD